MPRRTVAVLLPVAVLALILGLNPFKAGAATMTEKRFLPLVSCPTCTGQVVQPTPPPVDTNAYEARIIELVNQARLAAGCPAATPNAALMDATGAWSDYMDRTGDYSHGTFEQFQQKYAAYTGPVVLENIAGVINSPDLTFDAWYDSSLHYRNMVYCYHPDDPSYDPAMTYSIGIGYVNGYWTLAIGLDD